MSERRLNPITKTVSIRCKKGHRLNPREMGILIFVLGSPIISIGVWDYQFIDNGVIKYYLCGYLFDSITINKVMIAMSLCDLSLSINQ